MGCISIQCTIGLYYVGLDWGGVSRELFQLLSIKCFDPSYKLFRRFSDNPQSLVSNGRKWAWLEQGVVLVHGKSIEGASAI